ncbi:MAG: glycogen debranching protein GlgX [Betaproteobacteria bacterium]|nr:glycogen debranching protein GlgX [Betaproteobacteria bacterium]
MSAELIQRTQRRLLAGNHFPLGATIQAGGVNFALYSKNAKRVFLLLFDTPDSEPSDVIELVERTRYVWHVFVEGVRAGQCYGYKVDGDYAPAQGMRFNVNKLLLDPYAKAVTGKFSNRDNLLLAYQADSPELDLSFDARDNSAVVPKAVVIDDVFDWQDDRRPQIPFEQLFIYEVHLKGFTAHPSSGVRHPGTYRGFIEKIPYLKSLGINAVELLPIQECCPEDVVLRKGLTNYWGYNTIAFFAPESSYSTCRGPTCPVEEFKTLVRELHKAGIEVILDVVYNHTAEGDERGPSMSFRGIDNREYYSLTGSAAQPARYYENFSGCGNDLDFGNPAVIRMVMDSLRYWVEVMHVDGFRFDLASVLGRDGGGFHRTASFFDVISQDPVMQHVKLIAEPWDLGSSEVGNFPVDWSEWNSRFRDTVRKFVKGDAEQLSELGSRITGSADLYEDDGRSAYNSINFVTCHDGFTLHDLVAYNRKRNEANLEGNVDGRDDNYSWNCGVEGETDDPAVLRLRRQQMKNLLCLLIFSMGTPMLLAGDEVARSQGGNNNAYCQDNETSWFDWTLLERNADLFTFTHRLIMFQQICPVLQRRKFVLGVDSNDDGIPDISWFGRDLGSPRWNDPQARLLCYRLDGGEIPSPFGRYYLLFILNAGTATEWVELPPPGAGLAWYRIIDTSLPAGEDFLGKDNLVRLEPDDVYITNPHSTVVLVAY